MKKLNYILLTIILGSLIFCSCKKDPSVPTTTGGSNVPQSNTILTSTNWKLVHEYFDTSAYAKANLNLWPLSSTSDPVLDSCEITSKIKFKANHDLYTIRGFACPSSDPDSNYVGTWDLIMNDTKIVFSGSDTMDVLQINNNAIKLWYKSYYSQGSTIIYTIYNVWVYEPTN